MSEFTFGDSSATSGFDALNAHLRVIAAIEARGGRLVASLELDDMGRTIGAPTPFRAYRCSSCHADGHSIERCNGPGVPPRPSYSERRVQERIRKIAKRHDYDLDAAKAELQRRIEARKK